MYESSEHIFYIFGAQAEQSAQFMGGLLHIYKASSTKKVVIASETPEKNLFFELYAKFSFDLHSLKIFFPVLNNFLSLFEKNKLFSLVNFLLIFSKKR